MKLYHGTQGEKGKAILESGLISIDQESNYTGVVQSQKSIINLSTTQGYIYLTDNLFVALHYANTPCLSDKCRDKKLYIFRLEIPENLLLPDIDEYHMKQKSYSDIPTMYESLKYFHSVRVNQNLYLKNYQTAFIELNSSINVNETFTEERATLRENLSIAKITLRYAENDELLNDYQKNMFGENLNKFTSTYQWECI